MSNTVNLKNGSEEHGALVNVVLYSLNKLMADLPIVLYELVQVARDASHEPFGETGKDLEKRGLLQPDGRMPESIRNVVLSAVVGEGLDLELVNPRATEEATR